MKLRYLSIALSASLLGVAACQPDEYDLGGTGYSAADLQQGASYTVAPDAANPNIIHLRSNVKGVTPEWILTDGGTSQKAQVDLNLPFAGTYSVTFGVGTPGGVVYGEPYTFTVQSNDFTMLDNPLWTYLAGGVGKSKTWVPVDKSYGVGNCTGPVMYCNPDDVMNDGSGSTNMAFEAWKPNWDPGFQDWLIPASDPYMGSSMTFGLDATKGCTLTEFRGDANGGQTLNGTFSLSLDDSAHPTISFNGGTFAMHNTGFDAVCDNYTKDIKIVELTPYMLQLATMRTNSEGAWWLIWNFVAKEVQEGAVVIPVEEVPVEAATVGEIADNNLAKSLFTQDIDGVEATLSSVTLNFNQDQPYGFYWWNGGSSAWEASAEADYGKKEWYPAATSTNIEDFALILTKAADGTYKFEEEEAGISGTFTIDGNDLIFSRNVVFFSADGIEMATNKLTVVKASSVDNEYYFAVPSETNAAGQVCKYLYANLKQKAIGGAASGPVEIAIDQTKISWGYGDTGGKAIRVTLYNTWSGPTDAFDIAKAKLKKGKTLKVSFQITSGVTWVEGAAPKAILRHNVAGLGVGSDWFGFGEADAVAINKSGVTTLSLTNDTGSAADFSTGSLQIVIQIDSANTTAHDLCDITVDEAGEPTITGTVSMTIE